MKFTKNELLDYARAEETMAMMMEVNTKDKDSQKLWKKRASAFKQIQEIINAHK